MRTPIRSIERWRKGRGFSAGSSVEARDRTLTCCDAALLSHDIERPELCVMAAMRRLADDITPMRMALAADEGVAADAVLSQ